MYKDNLSIGQKQYLAYLILSTKDLIGIYASNPKDKDLEIKMKKYIDILIGSEYIGYCVLYNGLKTLVEVDKNYVENNARLIVAYAQKDAFSKQVIMSIGKDVSNLSEKQNQDLMKIKNNYDYVSRINTLLESK